MEEDEAAVSVAVDVVAAVAANAGVYSTLILYRVCVPLPTPTGHHSLILSALARSVSVTLCSPAEV